MRSAPHGGIRIEDAMYCTECDAESPTRAAFEEAM
jgi:hypothetical protein